MNRGRKIGRLGDYVLFSNGLEKAEVISSEPTVEQEYGAFNFMYGPSAGGLIESIGFNIYTSGEKILKIRPILYKDRIFAISGMKVKDALAVVERINANFSAAHRAAFLIACSKDIDYNMKLDMIVRIELERIRNNLHVIGRMVEASSQGVASNMLFYLRELINRAIDVAYGHRFFFNSEVGKFQELSGQLSIIVKQFNEIFNHLLDTRIFLDRLDKNGIIKDDSLIGPAARAAGFNYDARIDADYLPYSDLDFKGGILQESGDALGRFMVRASEIEKSAEIIYNALDIIKTKYAITPPVINGDGIGRVESPSGDLAYFVKIIDEKIKEVYLLSPSEINLDFFVKSMVGNIFTDFPFNWESFGIWSSELGVKFV